MSDFWHWYIVILVLLNIFGCAALLFWNSRMTAEEAARETTGHVYDGIEERNQPLPRWWLWLFVITLLFAALYLLLYPGLGRNPGLLGWTSAGQWQEEVRFLERQTLPVFEQYARVPVEELIAYPEALEVGNRLFAQNCALCHGSDARGNRGYPNLTDDIWRWGGSVADIQHSISEGRRAAMPPMGDALGGDQGVTDMAWYVASLSRPELADRDEVQQRIERAKPRFMVCAACHGPEGRGNPMLGAPDLVAGDRIYGGRIEDIEDTIRNGRSGVMPAQQNLLSPERIHVLTAYVYSLSRRSAND